MYAYAYETGSGFFGGCAGSRIGHSLFATYPLPFIRELTLRAAVAMVNGAVNLSSTLFTRSAV
jgi:hypothetical protein